MHETTCIEQWKTCSASGMWHHVGLLGKQCFEPGQSKLLPVFGNFLEGAPQRLPNENYKWFRRAKWTFEFRLHMSPQEFDSEVSVVALLLGAGPSLHFLPSSLRKAQRPEPYLPRTRTDTWSHFTMHFLSRTADSLRFFFGFFFWYFSLSHMSALAESWVIQSGPNHFMTSVTLVESKSSKTSQPFQNC